MIGADANWRSKRGQGAALVLTGGALFLPLLGRSNHCSHFENTGLITVPKMRKKADLPTKLCATCGLSFAWRKKWEKVWNEVRYCSDRCREAARKRPASP